MGEVYRATDTKLDREVAIKLLPAVLSQDKERLARFEREAKVLAQLNHPNVATVYGFDQHEGTSFLVMELVEGEDLSSRLAGGALPIDEAIDIARQIAEGLVAAHEKGIIHRDLKPANIKVTSNGHVKVLDFGLAKALADDEVGRAYPRAVGQDERPPAPGTASEALGGNGSRVRSPHQEVSPDESPTITDAFTQPGTILGTAAYMSPEQARGKPIDTRSDIWSFGCVLYESLTGVKAFQGEDVTETLAGILKGEPDWAVLDRSAPVALRRLVRRCLVKDRRRRWQDVADARIELEEAASDPNGLLEVPTADGNRARGTALGFPAFLLATVVAIATAGVTWFLKPPETGAGPGSSKPRSVRSELILADGARLFQKFANPFALSPDGSRLAYIRVDDKVVTDRQLHIRDLGTGIDVLVPDTSGIVAPFFSPDGNRIGFVSDQSMITQRLDGGDRRKIVSDSLRVFSFNAADWSEDGHIVYAQPGGRPLMIVDENGLKPPRALTEPGDDESHSHPRFLDAGRLVGFSVVSRSTGEVTHTAVVHTETGKTEILDVGPCNEVRYWNGFLFCSVRGEVHVVPFDLKTLQVTGPRKPVLSGVRSGRRTVFEFTRDGTVVYQAGHDSVESKRGLFWVEENGNIIPFSDRSGDWDGFELAPDEKRVAVMIESDIWILNTQQEGNHTLQPLVQHPANDHHPVWSPDGSLLYFFSDRETPDGAFGIWRVRTDAVESVEPELIYASDSVVLLPDSASDKRLVLTAFEPSGDPNAERVLQNIWDLGDLRRQGDIWSLDLRREEARPEPLVVSPDLKLGASISPDGQWLAYSSDRARTRQIYVKRLSPPGPIRPVSPGGGRSPVWAPDGRKLYWLSGPACLYVDWSEDGTPGTEVRRLMDQQFFTVGNTDYSMSNYAVSGEGHRGLVLARDAESVMKEWLPSAPPITLNLITHWFEEFASGQDDGK